MVSEDAFADLVALCQFLPGLEQPGEHVHRLVARRDSRRPAAAWLGFTLPSAAALTAFAWLLGVGGVSGSGWLHGIMLAAVGVVAQAVWGMAARLSADAKRAAMTAAAAISIATSTSIMKAACRRCSECCLDAPFILGRAD